MNIRHAAALALVGLVPDLPPQFRRSLFGGIDSFRPSPNCTVKTEYLKFVEAK
jgi:hypothetical protein